MSSNESLQQSTTSITYVELVRQNGGQHSMVMWVFMATKCIISLVGILLNATLVATTVKSKKLHHTCNVLLALDSAFSAVFQLNAFIIISLPIFGTNFVPISLCFYLQAVPYFSVLMSFCLMFQIGLERLGSVLFPIWSKNDSSKHFHVLLFVVSTLSNCYLIWLQYEGTVGVGTMVLCTGTSIVAFSGLSYTISFIRSVILHILLLLIYAAIFLIMKFKNGTQNFSRDIFRSLLFLIILDLIGWFPLIFMIDFLQMFHVLPVMSTYISTGLNCLASIIASANAPTLYYFGHLYRKEMRTFLHGIGIKLFCGAGGGGDIRHSSNRQTNSLVVTKMNNLMISSGQRQQQQLSSSAF